MSSLFDEILLDPLIFSAGDAVGGPEFANTNIKNALTGVFKTNINRFDFQQSWTIDFNQLNHTQRLYLMQFWVGGFGSGYGFRCWIFNDFYAIAEVLGTSDGTIASKTWLLTKKYRRPGASHSYSKRIIKPVINAHPAAGSVTLYEPDGITSRAIPSTEGALNGVPAFTVYLNGVAQTTGFTIDNTTGTLVFTSAPANGVVVSYSGEYDYPVKIMQNSLGLKADLQSEIKSVLIVEQLPAEFSIV